MANILSSLKEIGESDTGKADLDTIYMLVEMRSQHEKGNKTAGLNVFTGKVVDMWKEGVLEPLRIKTQAISSATEAATMILRIDDVLSAKLRLQEACHQVEWEEWKDWIKYVIRRIWVKMVVYLEEIVEMANQSWRYPT